VERFLGEITAKVIRPGSFRSVGALVANISRLLDHHNLNPKPYRWTADPQAHSRKTRSRLGGPPGRKIQSGLWDITLEEAVNGFDGGVSQASVEIGQNAVAVFFESSGEFAEGFEPRAVGPAQPQAFKKGERPSPHPPKYPASPMKNSDHGGVIGFSDSWLCGAVCLEFD
jgi:hypothetical protein